MKNYKIEGLDELNKQLEQLRAIIPAEALLVGAYKLMGFSMENSPVDTGYLRQSHYSEIVDKNKAQMVVGAEYAVYQEFGNEHMEAKGFVRKSIDEHDSEILKAIKDHLQDDINGAV